MFFGRFMPFKELKIYRCSQKAARHRTPRGKLPYTLNEEEKAKWAGKLQDKQIVIGVRELVPFGGRLRARGAIVTGPDGKSN